MRDRRDTARAGSAVAPASSTLSKVRGFRCQRVLSASQLYGSISSRRISVRSVCTLASPLSAFSTRPRTVACPRPPAVGSWRTWPRLPSASAACRTAWSVRRHAHSRRLPARVPAPRAGSASILRPAPERAQAVRGCDLVVAQPRQHLRHRGRAERRALLHADKDVIGRRSRRRRQKSRGRVGRIRS